MNIREITRTSSANRCRECHLEVWEPYVSHCADNTHTTESVTLVRAMCITAEQARHESNNGDLFALEARTASGRKIEVVCRKHLLEIIDKIRHALGQDVAIGTGEGFN